MIYGPTNGPLVVHPINPRYFCDACGEPVYLTGSHTWATLQERGVEGVTPDFDYGAYLDFMIANGLEPDNFYNPQVNFTVGMGAIVLLILAGMVAGLIPAVQAARINPVDALKDE